MGVLILILLLGFALLLMVRWVIWVTVYGRGLIFPNWTRVDRKLMEKHNVNANYEDSFWWKLSHYFFILMIVGFIFLVRFIIMM